MEFMGLFNNIKNALFFVLFFQIVFVKTATAQVYDGNFLASFDDPDNSTARKIAIIKMTDDKLVVLKATNPSSGVVKTHARVVTISGRSISVSSSEAISQISNITNFSNGPIITTRLTDDLFVTEIPGYNISTKRRITLIAGQVNGDNTISFGNPIETSFDYVTDAASFKFNFYDIARLGDNKFVLAYVADLATDVIRLTVGEVSGTTITLDESNQQDLSEAGELLTICELGTNKYALAYKDPNPPEKAVVLAGTVSGTTPSTDEANLIDNASTGEVGEMMEIEKLDIDKAVLHYRNSTATGDPNSRSRAVIITFSGTIPTLGTSVEVSDDAASDFNTNQEYVRVGVISPTRFVCLNAKSQRYATTIDCSISGTTIRTGTESFPGDDRFDIEGVDTVNRFIITGRAGNLFPSSSIVQLLVGIVPNPPAPWDIHPWPMYQYNAQNTALSQLIGPETGSISLSKPTNSIVNIVVAENDILYLGMVTGLATPRYNLVALNADGTDLWTFPGAQPSAIGADGTIYAIEWNNANSGDTLKAINPDGDLIWQFVAPGFSIRPVTVAEDGTIYFGNSGGQIFSLNPDGSLLWMTPRLGPLQNEIIGTHSAPAIGQDGTVYINGLNAVYALDPTDGSVNWTYTPTSAGNHFSVTLGDDDTIYLGLSGITALNPDGSAKWNYSISGGGASPIAVASDGTVYGCFFSNATGTTHLHSVSPDNSLNWTFDLGFASRPFALAIGSNGIIYTGETHQTDSKIVAVDANGTLKWQYGPWPKSNAALGSNGTLYAGALLPNGQDFGLLAFNDKAAANTPPIAVISAPEEAAIFQVDQLISFDASGTTDKEQDSGTLTYTWDFGDGTSGTGMIVEHAYSESGDYGVTLEVSDNEVLTDSKSVNITALRIQLVDVKVTPTLIQEGDFPTISGTVLADGQPTALEITVHNPLSEEPTVFDSDVDGKFSFISSEPIERVTSYTLTFSTFDYQSGNVTLNVHPIEETSDAFTIPVFDPDFLFQGRHSGNLVNFNSTPFILTEKTVQDIALESIIESARKVADISYKFYQENKTAVGWFAATGIVCVALTPVNPACTIMAGIGMRMMPSVLVNSARLMANNILDSPIINLPNEDYIKLGIDAGALIVHLYMIDPTKGFVDIESTKPFALTLGTVLSDASKIVDEAKGIECQELRVENGLIQDIRLEVVTKDEQVIEILLLRPSEKPWFYVWSNSPVDIELLNPSGTVTNKDVQNIENSVYLEGDLDGDGEIEDLIKVHDPIGGNYRLNVIPEPDALPNDHYSILLNRIGIETKLVENALVSEIPSAPFTFPVTADIPLQDVSQFILPIIGGVFWDPLTQTFSFDVALTNLGPTDILFPIHAKIADLVPPPPTVTVNDADGGGDGIGAFWDYSALLGNDATLTPGDTSEYKRWEFYDPSITGFTFTVTVEAVVPSSLPKQASSHKIKLIADIDKKEVKVELLNLESDPKLPKRFALLQNYPNPFNPETTIEYQLPERAKVTLAIYNVLGQEILTLVNEDKEAGYYSIAWDGKDKFGNQVSSGIYVYQIKARDFVSSKKLVLLR